MTTRVLAIDTATEACSAAILVAGEVQERFLITPRRHSALILPMIEEVLAEARTVTTRSSLRSALRLMHQRGGTGLLCGWQWLERFFALHAVQ